MQRRDDLGRARVLDLVSIGETMALVVPEHAEPLETAQAFRLDIGGAESNVACHLARAGRRTAWFGAVGDDALGRRVRAQVAACGVDVGQVRADPSAPTGVYLKDPGAGVSYYRRGSAASRLGPEALADLDWARIRIVHLSGISPALSTANAALVEAAIRTAHREGVRVSFDVNFRPALWSASAAGAALRALAALADIVFVGLDEAAVIWGTGDAGSVRDLLPDVPHLIVKDADVSATEFAADTETRAPAHRVEVVEPVGAGDAFAAGWLDALLDEDPPEARLRRGHEFAIRALASTRDVPAPAQAPGAPSTMP